VSAATATGGGAIAGGVALKAAAVVTAATVAGGVAVTGATESGVKPGPVRPAAKVELGERIGQVSPRGVLVPGDGVARGKEDAPGQVTSAEAKAASARAPGQSKQGTHGSVASNRAGGKGAVVRKAGTPGSSRAPSQPSGAAKQPVEKKAPKIEKRTPAPKAASKPGGSKKPASSELGASGGDNGSRGPKTP
jgi:hypothetical protein